MGNKTPKNQKNFFKELKTTTSYRGFIIKMNQMISRGNIDWSIDRTSIPKEEIDLNLELIENFFFYASDYIFEQAVKKKQPDKKSLRHLAYFIDLIKNISLILISNHEEFLKELFFVKINKDQKINIIRENGFISEVNIDGEKYQGKIH